MLRLLAVCFLILEVYAREEDYKYVKLEGLGTVKGAQYWDGEFHEFYGIPYAKAPEGRDRYKAPLPPAPWKDTLTANRAVTLCHQVYLTGQGDDAEDYLAGGLDCLVAHVMAPKIATEKNLVPVVVYIHSGAYSGGSAFMAQSHKVAHQNVVAVALNYRLGALGFACLGTESIPGNAALKDIVAGLKWVNKHIKSFGGDPNQVTLAGYSIGASLAELVALTKEADGLFHRLMLDSGSALMPFAVNREPIETARNIAKAAGFEDSGTFEDLEEFYLGSDLKPLLDHSRNFFLKNSTFGFVPCIENPKLPGALLTESPHDILKRGDYAKFDYLAGFANMEGISRTSQFEEWKDMMNDKFEDFLPADLKFTNNKERDAFIKEVKQKYFQGKEVSLDTLQGYVDYYSDSMFKYGLMRSAKLHAARRPIYVYEFTYFGKLNTHHLYMDRIFGASHRDATSYVLDFHDWTRNYTDMNHRDNMVFMWTDFVKYGNPTAYESTLLKTKWLKYTNEQPNYLDIGYELVNKKGLFEESFKFWDKVYQKNDWVPTAPNSEGYKPTVAKSVKPVESAPAEKKADSKAHEKVVTEKEINKVGSAEGKAVPKGDKKVEANKDSQKPKVARSAGENSEKVMSK